MNTQYDEFDPWICFLKPPHYINVFGDRQREVRHNKIGAELLSRLDERGLVSHHKDLFKHALQEVPYASKHVLMDVSQDNLALFHCPPFSRARLQAGCRRIHVFLRMDSRLKTAGMTA